MGRSPFAKAQLRSLLVSRQLITELVAAGGGWTSFADFYTIERLLEFIDKLR